MQCREELGDQCRLGLVVGTNKAKVRCDWDDLSLGQTLVQQREFLRVAPVEQTQRLWVIRHPGDAVSLVGDEEIVLEEGSGCDTASATNPPGAQIDVVHERVPIGLELIDTPGYSSPTFSSSEDSWVDQLLARVDVVLLVVSCESALGRNDTELIKRALQEHATAQIVLVLNKIDQLREPAEYETVLASVKAKAGGVLGQIPHMFPFSCRTEFAEQQHIDRLRCWLLECSQRPAEEVRAMRLGRLSRLVTAALNLLHSSVQAPMQLAFEKLDALLVVIDRCVDEIRRAMASTRAVLKKEEQICHAMIDRFFDECQEQWHWKITLPDPQQIGLKFQRLVSLQLDGGPISEHILVLREAIVQAASIASNNQVLQPENDQLGGLERSKCRGEVETCANLCASILLHSVQALSTAREKLVLGNWMALKVEQAVASWLGWGGLSVAGASAAAATSLLGAALVPVVVAAAGLTFQARWRKLKALAKECKHQFRWELHRHAETALDSVHVNVVRLQSRASYRVLEAQSRLREMLTALDADVEVLRKAKDSASLVDNQQEPPNIPS